MRAHSVDRRSGNMLHCPEEDVTRKGDTSKRREGVALLDKLGLFGDKGRHELGRIGFKG